MLRIDNAENGTYTQIVRYTQDTHLDNLSAMHLEDKEHNIIMVSGQMSLSEFVDFWMLNYKLNTVKRGTYSRLCISVTAMKKFDIARMPIAEINLFTIQAYVSELVSKGLASTTIKKQIEIVTAPLKIAAAMHIIPSDPSIGVRMPSKTVVKKKPRDVSAYTKDEQERLIEVLRTRKYIGFDAIWFMMETGLRSGEMLALKWADVNLSRRSMNIHATIINPIDCKNAVYQDSAKSDSSNRIIPLSAKATEILTNLKAHAKTEWVFEYANHRLSYESLVRHTKIACEKAGVPYKGEHVFRHTFATNCYYKKMDIKVLSKILGHAKVDITYNTYINLYGDGFDEMLGALDAC